MGEEIEIAYLMFLTQFEEDEPEAVRRTAMGHLLHNLRYGARQGDFTPQVISFFVLFYYFLSRFCFFCSRKTDLG